MEGLYAPWRSEYFTNSTQGCVFCHIADTPEDDEALGVLFRDTHCYGVMNRYPYTPGHFMIIPYEHTSAIETLDEVVWDQMSAHVRTGVKMLKETFGVLGVNIGMNLGECAGAGIAEHVHYHLVPRWQKDTNFITTIGEIRVHGVPFEGIYERLKQASLEHFKMSTY
ncbi:HIT domain-containing protein [Sulfurospirillum sp. T05]|uniref:HIT domain-containing protein n=1 Tax=Sulfurospirillum tamanense TaxID=2813362 RepID=A0ABS2WSJ8_9BACT|nr:HIT domain-containing protein [Sulfurospirillum tamanensis]MBN2964615.1 HIT domain-containing protein [Sulfurospirillum tamanensis]